MGFPTWPKEYRDRARALYLDLRSLEEVSKAMGVAPRTVSHWCEDITAQEAADKQKQIDELLRLANDDPDFDSKKYAAQHGLHVRTVRRYLKNGRAALENSKPRALSDKVLSNPDCILVRKLYGENKTYNEIHQETGISKSSISLWCRDLVTTTRGRKIEVDRDAELRETARSLFTKDKAVKAIAAQLGIGKARVKGYCEDLLAKRRPPKKVKEVSLKPRQGNSILTNEQVGELRDTVNETKIKDYQAWGKRFGVSVSVISMAARGVSFKHLNVAHPPVEKDAAQSSRPKTREWKRDRPDEIVISEAIALYKAQPDKWTCTSLAEWMREKTGRQYRGNHIAIIFRNRDPDMILPKHKDPKPVTPVYKYKVLTPEQVKAKSAAARLRRQAKKAEEESLRLFIENEDRRDRGLAELTPAEREVFLKETVGGNKKGVE